MHVVQAREILPRMTTGTPLRSLARATLAGALSLSFLGVGSCSSPGASEASDEQCQPVTVREYDPARGCFSATETLSGVRFCRPPNANSSGTGEIVCILHDSHVYIAWKDHADCLGSDSYPEWTASSGVSNGWTVRGLTATCSVDRGYPDVDPPCPGETGSSPGPYGQQPEALPGNGCP
jgi:hypothetical protein